MFTKDITTLTNRFIDLWSDTLPVTYDHAPNAEYPNGYIHFSVMLGASKHWYGDRITGAKKQIGRIILNAYVPDHLGNDDGFRILEKFSAIFRNWTDGKIVVRTEDIDQPITGKDGLVRFRVSIPFESVRNYNAA